MDFKITQRQNMCHYFFLSSGVQGTYHTRTHETMIHEHMEIHADEFTQTRKLEYNASMSDAEGLTVGGSLLGAISSAR